MDIDEYIAIASQAYVKVQNQPFVEVDMEKAIRFGAELTKGLLES